MENKIVTGIDYGVGKDEWTAVTIQKNGKALNILGTMTGRTTSSQPNLQGLGRVQRDVEFGNINEARRLAELLRTFGLRVYARHGTAGRPPNMRKPALISLETGVPGTTVEDMPWWHIEFVRALRAVEPAPHRYHVARALLIEVGTVGLDTIARLAVSPREAFAAMIEEGANR